MKHVRLLFPTFLVFILCISLVIAKLKTPANAAYVASAAQAPTIAPIPTPMPTNIPEPTSTPVKQANSASSEASVPTAVPTAIPTPLPIEIPIVVAPTAAPVVVAPVVASSASDQERYMFDLVNKERASRGLGAFSFDDSLANVGRAHCKDMVDRGYFSHDTPEGVSPFSRIDQAGIGYSFAGENLALAPNVDMAMGGLMGSEGHKNNILSPNFGRIGIGIYGDKFCQEFAG